MNRELKDFEISRSSYVDPNGFVFTGPDGQYYRAIYKQVSDYYLKLIEDGSIRRLSSEHRLISTEVSDLAFPGTDIGLVLKHERIEPLSFCNEWCASMIQDAGLALLDLAIAVLESNSLLQDCYPWNVLYRGAEPVIVDFTSIVPAGSPLLWPAYEQFLAFFYRPLLLCEQGKGKIARMLLSNNITGILLEDLDRNSGAWHHLKHPSISMEHKLDGYLQRHPSLKLRLRQRLAGLEKQPDPAMRRRFLQQQMNKVKKFHFRGNRDVWSSYYSELGPQVDRAAKLSAIDSILQKLKPASVVDLGCNTGVFSIQAARHGARVMAIDSSEICIEQLYQTARKDQLRITPLISDLFCPTPAGGFLARQYADLPTRAKSELAMCLGLMHHLHIAGRQSLDRIAELMDAVSGKHLIFEYVSREDDNNVLLGAGRSIDYNLEKVMDALRRYFPQIETMDSDRSTRKILVCSK